MVTGSKYGKYDGPLWLSGLSAVEKPQEAEVIENQGIAPPCPIPHSFCLKRPPRPGWHPASIPRPLCLRMSRTTIVSSSIPRRGKSRRRAGLAPYCGYALDHGGLYLVEETTGTGDGLGATGRVTSGERLRWQNGVTGAGLEDGGRGACDRSPRQRRLSMSQSIQPEKRHECDWSKPHGLVSAAAPTRSLRAFLA